MPGCQQCLKLPPCPLTKVRDTPSVHHASDSLVSNEQTHNPRGSQQWSKGSTDCRFQLLTTALDNGPLFISCRHHMPAKLKLGPPKQLAAVGMCSKASICMSPGSQLVTYPGVELQRCHTCSQVSRSHHAATSAQWKRGNIGNCRGAR